MNKTTRIALMEVQLLRKSVVRFLSFWKTLEFHAPIPAEIASVINACEVIAALTDAESGANQDDLARRAANLSDDEFLHLCAILQEFTASGVEMPAASLRVLRAAALLRGKAAIVDQIDRIVTVGNGN